MPYFAGLAYDAAVTLAIVADRLLDKEPDPAKHTAEDWLKGKQG